MQRYNDLSSYLKEKFGSKLLKLSIDGGFSCPNRKNGKSGCKFCSESGSGEFTTKRKSITEQLNAQIEFLKDKDKNNGYIAYFQSYTNTFLPVEQLRKMYYEAINFPNVKVLSIATRADCFNEEIYNLLSELNEKIEVWIELGLQTSNENTRNNMNIGYSTKTFENCVKRLKELNIKTIFHIIFGLPNETEKDYKNTIDYVNNKKPWGIKIHSLYIQNDCELYEEYLKNSFKVITWDEYIDALIMAIENLDKDIIFIGSQEMATKKNLLLPYGQKIKLKQ